MLSHDERSSVYTYLQISYWDMAKRFKVWKALWILIGWKKQR